MKRGALLMVFLLAMTAVACTNGIQTRFATVGSTPQRPAHDGPVYVFYANPISYGYSAYQRIGTVTARSFLRDEYQLVQALKAKAAAYGANAIIIEGYDYQSVARPDPTSEPKSQTLPDERAQLMAQAIYIEGLQ